MAYQIEILNKSGGFVAPIRNTAALDKSGQWLRITKKLSDWGTCRFRVSTKDPIFTTEGDILTPWKYHVRVRRDGVTIWQGVIIKNLSRTKYHIDVEARTYLYMLDRVLIRHDASDGKGSENYRTLRAGTLAASIQTLVSEATTDMGVAMTSLTAGTIDNPNFPADFKDSTGTTLSGAWTWSDTFQYKFDYRSLLFVLKVLGGFANFDFEVTNSFVLNFKSYIGNKQPELKFFYGEFGNIRDYDTPLDGEGMANFIQAVAADNDFNIIHAEASDQASINEYGKIPVVAAYVDVKNTNLLISRSREELNLVKTPGAEVHLVLNNKAFPIGQWDVGDTVTVEIKDHVINVSEQRRIVGYEIDVEANMEETVRLITNKPRDTQ